MHLPHVLPVAALCAAALLSGCSPPRTPGARAPDASTGAARGEGLILQADEGERRVRRPRPGTAAVLTAPFILKVDARNGGSRALVMGYEDIPPGQAIQPHQHLHADEIIFVHRGSGVASLGGREGAVSAGATIYIPRDTRISLRNTGSEPLGIAFVFSKPGFEDLMRENSVLEGEPATPVSAEELARTRARHRWHTVYEQP
jgi:quercetin dioxygenase-like cupin family protein